MKGTVTMIDRAARSNLALHLRQLVTGRIRNDEYDEHYYDRYINSQDAAVRAVATFGWSLYSDSCGYRLKGAYSVSTESRRIAAHCVLFLQSELEYEWPPMPRDFVGGVIDSLALNLGLPGGIAVAICGFALFPDGDFELGIAVILLGLVTALASGWQVFGGRFCDSTEWRVWKRHGAFDVWPFPRNEDFERANATLHLFGRRSLTTGTDECLPCPMPDRKGDGR
jgi:hypothetical protein